MKLLAGSFPIDQVHIVNSRFVQQRVYLVAIRTCGFIQRPSIATLTREGLIRNTTTARMQYIPSSRCVSYSHTSDKDKLLKVA